MKTLWLAVALATALVPFSAKAQLLEENDPIAGINEPLLEDEAEEGSLQLHFLPPGIRCEFEGTTFQCFALQEYRLLLQLDNDLFHYQLRLETLEETIVSLERIQDQLNQAITGYQSQVDVLQTERRRLLERWTEENRLRLEAENVPDIGTWLAWGLVGVEAAVVIGLVVGLLVGG